jgi:negative regulator of flagellin synthesis FlgM
MSEINNIKTANQAILNSQRNVKARDTDNPSQSQAVSDSAKPNDKVSLTDTATQLDSLRQTISDSPEVNTDRVEALRAAIADGSYSVDTAALAQNLINFETQLK